MCLGVVTLLFTGVMMMGRRTTKGWGVEGGSGRLGTDLLCARAFGVDAFPSDGKVARLGQCTRASMRWCFEDEGDQKTLWYTDSTKRSDNGTGKKLLA